MLKTTRSTRSATNPKKTEGKISGDSVVGNMVGSGEATNPTKGKNQVKTTKSKILVKFKNHDFPKSRIEEIGTRFFTLQARLAFTQLRQAFIKTPIFHYSNLESYIWIKTDISGYAIRSVLSQLSSGNRPDKIVIKVDLGQWHPVVFFSRKMIPAETWYKTHNGKFLAIVKAFKIWRHYLEDCKHDVLVLTDHNNLRHFIDTKNLSFRQVRWAQKLFCYYFRIDYQQNKANGAANTLSQYSQQNTKEKATLQAKNTKIFYRL